MNYKLSDEAISLIAKLVQVGILTGTDIVDNLRTLRLEETHSQSELLRPTESFVESFNNSINALLQRTSEFSTDAE
jgi:hypothetical protein